MLVQAQVVALGKRGDRQSSPSGTNPSRASPTGRRIGGYDYKTKSFQRPRVEHYTRFREMRNSNFFGAPPLGVGVFGKLPAARKRKDRQRNRLGRSQQAPACPRNRKPAGDLARQIEPLPSRSGRLLDYESSGSPCLSRSYRRPGTESLPVTEVTGSNLRHASPGAGRALVG